jgi:hypothetical protein
MRAILVGGSLVALALGLLIVSPNEVYAENIDPGNDNSQYAYGENIGWFNAEPSGDGGPGVEVEHNKLTGYMWLENIGWVSLSCQNTSSCQTINFGVINDGSGQLSGYAWSENVGWINFSCLNKGNCDAMNYGVYIDTVSGEFSGLAWAENIGWINFDLVSHRILTSWEPSVSVCDGDFAPWDGDVDGSDLATLADDLGLLRLTDFALEYGRVDCFQ